MEKRNAVAQVCALYNETWNATYATNTGYTSGSDVYTIALSVTGSNSTDPGVCVPPAAAAQPQPQFNNDCDNRRQKPPIQ